MDTLCRICIKKAAKYTLLNTKIENSSNLSFFDFLNKCTSLNACESDKLPQRLCSICTRSIKTFYSFLNLAEKSNTILREALKTSIATGKYNDNREISCEEVTITNCKIEQDPAGFSKEESLHSQTSRNSTGSSLYILNFVKEESHVFESTPIVEFKGAEINESEKLHCNLDHPERIVEEPDDILLCVDRRLASKEGVLDPRIVRRSDRLIDNRGISCEEITIRNEKIKEEPEELNKEESLHCQAGKNSTGSSLYILDLVKEEPRVSERTSIIYFKDAEITENENFHSNLDYAEESIEEPDDTSSCIDGDLSSFDAEHNESEDDVPINLLKRGLVKSEDETESQSTKIKCEDYFKIEHGSRNQISSEATVDSLKQHFRGHAENSYKCVECDIIFNDKEKFRTHCRNHIYGDKHRCNICGKKFPRRKWLQKHLTIHDEKNKFKCSICGKGFKCSSYRLLHMKVHSDEKPFECEICGKKFRFNTSYKRHLRVHMCPPDKKQECEICSKKFSSKHKFKVHMENHKGIKKKCDQCDKEFKNNFTLKKHMKLHTEPKCEKCEICGKKFRTKYHLKRHMDSHNGIKKKCDQCDKEFKNSDTLWRHMKRHTEPKCEKCEICGKKFSSKRYLKVHMENHKGITKKCDRCDKEYTNSDSLRKHMKCHSDPKCEKCEICSKKFGRRDHLKRHMESHNGVIKKCDQCDKEFKNSESLRSHMKWHTNPKPFKCENCGKLLAKKDSYTYHMAICKPLDNSIEETFT